MYLPALRAIPDVLVVGVAGRDPDRTAEFARKWEIPNPVVGAEALVELPLDAVIVASSNDHHHAAVMAGLDRGLDVLCEKPLARTVDEAKDMAAAAERTGAMTLVPFTYRYMPMIRWMKELIDDGYLGRTLRMSARYFGDYAREPAYLWRLDTGVAGGGVAMDLGSHWLHVVRWLFGEVTEIAARTSSLIEHGPRPDGQAYEQAEDAATMTVRFASGAAGTIEVSSICWEGNGPFGQAHHFDAHGSDGTLYADCDWHELQEVRGVKAGRSGPALALPIPDHIWGGARRDTLEHTYQDVFGQERAMIGDFVRSVQSRVPVENDFAEGARVQELCAAAIESSRRGGLSIAV